MQPQYYFVYIYFVFGEYKEHTVLSQMRKHVVVTFVADVVTLSTTLQ